MRLCYADILEKIEERPKWWDSLGVPRFCDFHPDVCPNLYADEIVLLEVACQACKKIFLVQYEWNSYVSELPKPSENVECIFYGYPPHDKCCLMGPSQLSTPVQTIQFWVRNKKQAWIRRAELENLMIEG
jgi:hypothetical protein